MSRHERFYPSQITQHASLYTLERGSSPGDMRRFEFLETLAQELSMSGAMCPWPKEEPTMTIIDLFKKEAEGHDLYFTTAKTVREMCTLAEERAGDSMMPPSSVAAFDTMMNGIEAVLAGIPNDDRHIDDLVVREMLKFNRTLSYPTFDLRTNPLSLTHAGKMFFALREQRLSLFGDKEKQMSFDAIS